jgi:glycosyltransferase involved in cell wall biosynthesis
MIDKYYFVKGGAERYYFELKDILEHKGHTVIPFSMKHPANRKTPYAEYFVDNIDFDPGPLMKKIATGMRSIGRIFYSVQADRRLSRLIRKTRPDIAHLHMIDHQISPSILRTLKKSKIPVVQTVHTYKLVCPSYRLYHMGRQEVCEKCLRGHYWSALVERCHKNSFFATLLVVLETMFHKSLRFYERGVDLFLVPSRFMGRKLAEGGIRHEKIRHLFYTIDLSQYEPSFSSDPYFLYFGRLSEEKGLMTLLLAVEGGVGLPLHIIGEGPQRPILEKTVRDRRIGAVRFLGAADGRELKRAVSRARFVVVPSEWYENSPLVVYESMALGKPVIGAAIGGIPELIDPGVDGLLYPAGDAAALRDRILHLASHPEILPRMGRAARAKAERLFAQSIHYDRLMEMYLEAGRLNRNPYWFKGVARV